MSLHHEDIDIASRPSPSLGNFVKKADNGLAASFVDDASSSLGLLVEDVDTGVSGTFANEPKLMSAELASPSAVGDDLAYNDLAPAVRSLLTRTTTLVMKLLL